MNKKIFYILTIFFSFVLFDTNINAYSNSDFINVNYDNKEYVTDPIKNNQNFINFIDNNVLSKVKLQDYDYFVNFNNYSFESKFEYCITQKENKNDKFLIRSMFWKGSSGLELKPNDLIKRHYCYTSIDYANGLYTENNVFNYLDSLGFSTDFSMYDYANARAGSTSVNTDIYTSDNFKRFGFYSIIYESNTNIYISDINCDPGEFVPITFNGKFKSLKDDTFMTYKNVMGDNDDIVFGKENGLNYFDIPISKFYNSETKHWTPFIFYFQSESSTSTKFDFIIGQIPVLNIAITGSVLSGTNVPFKIYYNENILDIKEYIARIRDSTNSSENGYGGGFSPVAGSLGGGGGGGRFTDEEISGCNLANGSLHFNGKMTSINHFGSVVIEPCSLNVLDNFTPDDFETTYVRVYYKARLFENEEDLLDQWQYNDDLFIAQTDQPSLYTFFNGIFNLINNKFPIFGQLKQIVLLFDYDEKLNEEPPVFKIDFPEFGLSDAIVIDFEFYSKYRSNLFYLIYFFASWRTIFAAFSILHDGFGG